jgi:hypothetical protein
LEQAWRDGFDGVGRHDRMDFRILAYAHALIGKCSCGQSGSALRAHSSTYSTRFSLGQVPYTHSQDRKPFPQSP